MEKKNQPNYVNLDQKNKTVTNFRAYKQLIDAQTQLETLKNRLKVLQAADHKNQAKILYQTGQIAKLELIRSSRIAELRQIDNLKQKRLHEIEELKNKNQYFKKEHNQKIQLAKEEIAEQKIKEYLQICEKRGKIQSQIKQFKNNDLFLKQSQRKRIVENQEQGKQNYFNFLQTKIGNVMIRNKCEVQEINMKRKQKQSQLQKMANLQLQLLKKQSQSQIACQQLKNKLNTIMFKDNANNNSRLSHNSPKFQTLSSYQSRLS